MKLGRLMLATALACTVALPLGAQPITREAPRSEMPAENDLIRVLGRTSVRGDGANGVPRGVVVTYSVTNVNRCAPRLQLWAGRAGSQADAPFGRPKALPVNQIAGLVMQGTTQLKVEFRDGSNLILAANSAAHRQTLANALQNLGIACRDRRG